MAEKIRNVAIRVPEEIHKPARLRLAEEGGSFQGVILEFLRAWGSREVSAESLQQVPEKLQGNGFHGKNKTVDDDSTSIDNFNLIAAELRRVPASTHPHIVDLVRHACAAVRLAQSEVAREVGGDLTGGASPRPRLDEAEPFEEQGVPGKPEVPHRSAKKRAHPA